MIKNNDCPTSKLLRILSGSWTIEILWKLSNHGPIRFGALKREVKGISSRMLTERLRRLEADGFVLRHLNPTTPPEVHYELSDQGLELRSVINELDQIAQRLHIDS